MNPDSENGLTSAQVQERTERGLVNENENPVTRTYRQIILGNTLTFFNFLNLALAVLVLAVGSFKNITFMGTIVFNTVIGIIQEIRAKRTLDDLAIMTESKAIVVRDGIRSRIPVSELVLDDVIVLRSGDQVPADARILDGELEVNESLLTGESDTLQKGAGGELYSGSFVTAGEARCQVTRVGKDSYAARLTSQAKQYRVHDSDLRNSLNIILKVVGIIIVPLGAILFYQARIVGGASLQSAVVSTVAAAIGMIPEGLILLTSVTLTVGALVLARRKVLVQELFCIETLARVDTLCLDKTGTITTGEMKVENLLPYSPRERIDASLPGLDRDLYNFVEVETGLDLYETGNADPVPADTGAVLNDLLPVDSVDEDRVNIDMPTDSTDENRENSAVQADDAAGRPEKTGGSGTSAKGRGPKSRRKKKKKDRRNGIQTAAPVQAVDDKAKQTDTSEDGQTIENGQPSENGQTIENGQPNENSRTIENGQAIENSQTTESDQAAEPEAAVEPKEAAMSVGAASESAELAVLPALPEDLVLVPALDFTSRIAALPRLMIINEPGRVSFGDEEFLLRDNEEKNPEPVRRPVMTWPQLEEILCCMMGELQDKNPTAEALREAFPPREGKKVIRTIPFSSERKYSGVVFEEGTFLLGAAQFLFPDGDPELFYKCADYGREGLRVLVLAMSPQHMEGKEMPADLTPAGLVLISDVIRQEAPRTLAYFAQQGVDIRIISGDAPDTVAAIAEKAGLKGAEHFIDASRLTTQEEMKKALDECRVFGRVTPAQKQEMVSLLKKAGHTVAMTGDGVNDVLALKEADCSIAMAGGSDAAKNVSNIVLLSSDFAAMPHIVNQGRRVIRNIRTASSMFLIKTIFSVLLSVITILLGGAYPFEPIQMSLIGACAVGIPTFLLSQENNYEKVEGGFLRYVFLNAFPAAVTITACVAAVMMVSRTYYSDPVMQSTACFLVTGWNYMSALRTVYAPLNRFRTVIIYGMHAVFFIAAVLLQHFLNLGALEFGMIIVVFVLMTFSPLLIQIITDFLRRHYERSYLEGRTPWLQRVAGRLTPK